jgi:hypothetical protein
VGNRKARAFMLQREQDAHWERIRTEPRPATRDVFARGIGLLRLQLIVCPSFEESRAWEVRRGEDEWWLFRPQVVESWPEVRLLGYEPVPFESERLEAFFLRLATLTLPIGPDLSGYGGCDGTMHQLAVFGDLYSAWRFQWWTRWPAHWQPLVELAAEMYEAFAAASRDA